MISGSKIPWKVTGREKALAESPDQARRRHIPWAQTTRPRARTLHIKAYFPRGQRGGDEGAVCPWKPESVLSRKNYFQGKP